MDNLENKTEESPKTSKEQGTLYRIIDKLMQFRKLITNSQPGFYRIIHYGDFSRSI